MNLLMLLAQAPEPEKAIGWFERIIQGGVPLICLCLAGVFGVAAFLIHKKKMDLEIAYREDLANRAN